MQFAYADDVSTSTYRGCGHVRYHTFLRDAIVWTFKNSAFCSPTLTVKRGADVPLDRGRRWGPRRSWGLCHNTAGYIIRIAMAPSPLTTYKNGNESLGV